MDDNLSRVPVFVFPTTVYFNVRDRDQMKQILTIYNPYEFPIRFKVLSNAPPDTYTVIDAEGSIRSKHSADLILRVSNAPPESGTHVEHKFRVHIYHFHDRKVIGRRDIPSIIHWGRLPPHLSPQEGPGSQSQSMTESFQQCPSSGTPSSGMKQHPISGTAEGPRGAFLPAGQQPNYVVILTALVCVIGLMLPISGEDKNVSSSQSHQTLASFVPSYLHVTTNQKLLAAYVLGLVTMVIFRP